MIKAYDNKFMRITLKPIKSIRDGTTPVVYIYCNITNIYPGFVEVFPTFDIKGKNIDNNVLLLPSDKIELIEEVKTQ